MPFGLRKGMQQADRMPISNIWSTNGDRIALRSDLSKIVGWRPITALAQRESFSGIETADPGEVMPGVESVAYNFIESHDSTRIDRSKRSYSIALRMLAEIVGKACCKSGVRFSAALISSNIASRPVFLST